MCNGWSRTSSPWFSFAIWFTRRAGSFMSAVETAAAGLGKARDSRWFSHCVYSGCNPAEPGGVGRTSDPGAGESQYLLLPFLGEGAAMNTRHQDRSKKRSSERHVASGQGGEQQPILPSSLRPQAQTRHSAQYRTPLPLILDLWNDAPDKTARSQMQRWIVPLFRSSRCNAFACGGFPEIDRQL